MQTSTFVGLGALVLGGVLAGAALMDDGDEPAWGRDASGGYPTGSGPAVVDARLAGLGQRTKP